MTYPGSDCASCSTDIGTFTAGSATTADFTSAVALIRQVHPFCNLHRVRPHRVYELEFPRDLGLIIGGQDEESEGIMPWNGGAKGKKVREVERE